ncbi:N amino acid transport system protein [Paramyrothecium foliicola]|nr:N amino acid transport system protein [Paramyrothecium foliicola]
MSGITPTAAPPAYDSSSREEISSVGTAKVDSKPPAQQPGMLRDAEIGEISEADMEKQKTVQGDAFFHRLGWKRLTVVLIVEAIALGSLSLPGAFASLGMVAGVILTVGMGLIAIYTSYIVGQVKLAFPQVSHYADAGQLMMGRIGYEVVGVMFALQLTFLVASHALTGTIAFLNITDNGACSLVFGVVSAIILLLLAIPPSFAEVAILGYIDFVSILLAIGITVIATGIQAGDAPGGLAAVNWSAWPKEGLTFAEAFIAVTNILFAYSFAVCQFSFMDEMHTPKDFVKSIWALGLIEIFIYTLTGALVYAFVGADVKSPALLSAGTLVSKIAFGVGLPVIFISGSINTTVVGRYIHGRVYKDSVTRFINTKKGWTSWLVLISAITIIAWVIAEAIPFFSDLLSISSSLFISGFTLYFPAMMWFMLIRKGPWYAKHNLVKSVVNGIIFLIGIATLVCGTYASIQEIIDKYNEGAVRGAFTCLHILSFANMIEEKWRYFAPGGAITPGGPSTWHILDWDQRRIISVTMDEEQESEDLAIMHLKKHIDTLGPDVFAIHLLANGELISVSTDPKDDETTCVYYPPLQALPGDARTVLRSELVELDRLGPNVDLVSYTPCTNATEMRKVVFKYYFLFQFLDRRWHELNLWLRLPPHPHLVPFDRVVLEELHGHVVGFTTLFIPGGTISENKSRVFKLEWIRQLMRVVDDLNLKYGIAHQDIAARNLLVNPETDELMLFDFNYSARIGDTEYDKDRNDVKGVIFTLYEIITRDTHYREIPHHEQNPADVEVLREWTQHPDVKLDHPVQEFRVALNEWVNKRREGKQITTYKEAPEYIEWPDFPNPPPEGDIFYDNLGNPTVVQGIHLYEIRRDQAKGSRVVNWERPAQRKLGNGDHLLANGQFVRDIN